MFNQKKYPWSNFHGMNLDWIVETVEYCKTKVDEFAQAIIDFPVLYEKKDDITNKRKLSPSGDFTGTWFTDTHSKITTDISTLEANYSTITDAINNRETFGLIYDGKIFPFTEDIETIIDGGVF